jgi:AcrR family transcriptional regulator
MSSEERRAAIVQAAVRLFAERGFRGTTTRALAKALRITEPVLYEHFKSKRELYCAIIESMSQEGMARATALLQPYAKAKDDRGFFTRLGEFVLECHSEECALYARLLLFVALEDPELGALFYDRQRQGRELLARYINRRIKEGAFRQMDPPLAARAFLGMVSHHGVLGLLYQDDFVQGSRKKIVEGMVDIFLRGISNSGHARK